MTVKECLAELKSSDISKDYPFNTRTPLAKLRRLVNKKRKAEAGDDSSEEESEEKGGGESREEMEEVKVTQELLDLNPEWLDQDVAVGDVIAIEKGSYKVPEDDSNISEEEKEQTEVDGGTVYSIGPDGKHVIQRVYSEDVHGKDFKKLAKQFASKNDFKVK